METRTLSASPRRRSGVVSGSVAGILLSMVVCCWAPGSGAHSVAVSAAASPACTLQGPPDEADVRGTVSLRVTLDPRAEIAQVALQVADRPPGPRVEVGASQQLSLSFDTRTLAKEGRNTLRAVCTRADGRVSSSSQPLELWVSNTRGSMVGTNGPLTREHIEGASKGLGIRWLRSGIEWGFHQSEAQFRSDVANRKRGTTWPALVPFRDQLRYAHQQGLRVLAVAMGSPRWARGADRRDGGNPWHQAILPQYRAAFAEYAKQLCLEGADAIEVLNEPNFRHEYAFGPDHPRAMFPDERLDDYVLLLRTVYDHIKADPRTRQCQIGIGGPASVGHELLFSRDFIHQAVWYRGLFNARADDRKTPVSVAGKFDFAAVHPYAEANTQSGPLEWGHRWGAFPFQYGDAAYAHGMAMVIRTREQLVAKGQADKKIWATEVGVATFGGSCKQRPCVSEQKQAAWLREYLRVWLSQDKTGWQAPLARQCYGSFTGPLFYYQWQDRSDGTRAPTDKEGFFGLVKLDGTRKAAFEELKSQAALPRP